MTTFSKFLAQYKNPNEKYINKKLILDMRQEPLLDYVLDVFKSLEVIKNIKMTGYEYIEDESKFDVDVVNLKHIKNKKNVNYKKRISIDPSRYSMLKVHFELKYKDKVEKKTVSLLLLKRIKKYYYLLGGNKFYPIYQLVENSTYTVQNSIIQRSIITPIIVNREIVELEDDNSKDVFKVPYYKLMLFKKKLNPILFYLATMGYTNTIRYMGMEDVVDIVKRNKHESNYYYFKVKNHYVRVIKFFFDNDYYTQSIVYDFYLALKEDKKFVYENLDDVYYWCQRLGSLFSSNVNKHLEKGKNVLISFNRLITKMVKRNLKLYSYNKANTHAVIRWMLQNFIELKAKDNMDLKNKRIRMSEYIALYFSMMMTLKVNRLLSKDKKDINMTELNKLFEIHPNELVKQIYKSKSPLLRYDNSVNDMDLFTALKFSVKGPGALGEKGKNSVGNKNRGIHHSHMGIIDINSCGTSDPGMSGTFSMFAETKGFYFDDSMECQEWEVNFKKLRDSYFKNKKTNYKGLIYFYEMENKYKNIVDKLEDVSSFIENDPYYNDDFNTNVDTLIEVDDCEKNRLKIIRKINKYKKEKEYNDLIDELQIKDKKLKKIVNHSVLKNIVKKIEE